MRLGVCLYQRNPTNSHHWRVNLARPSRDIDLAFRTKEHEIKEPGVGNENSEHLTDESGTTSLAARKTGSLCRIRVGGILETDHHQPCRLEHNDLFRFLHVK